MTYRQEPSTPVEVCFDMPGLLSPIVDQADVQICASARGVRRIILGDRFSTGFVGPLKSCDESKAVHHPHELSGESAKAASHVHHAAQEIREYLHGERQHFSVPLDPAPTSFFAARVHNVIATIGYGQRWTYAELAGAVHNPRAVRAVGTACGRNPLPILVPCHRVVRGDGSLGHYTGGDAIKVALLAIESP